jgi:hypothetical protein
MSALNENVFTFMAISRRIICRMRNVSYKSCRGNKNTGCIFSNFCPTIVVFRRKCRKIWRIKGGSWWQHGGALYTGYERLHTRKQTASPVLTHPPTPSHTLKAVFRLHAFSRSWSRYFQFVHFHSFSYKNFNIMFIFFPENQKYFFIRGAYRLNVLVVMQCFFFFAWGNGETEKTTWRGALCSVLTKYHSGNQDWDGQGKYHVRLKGRVHMWFWCENLEEGGHLNDQV